MDSITDICYDWSPNKEGRIREEYIEPLEKENKQLQAENARLKAERDKAIECLDKIHNRTKLNGIDGGYPYGATTNIGYDVYLLVKQWQGDESE